MNIQCNDEEKKEEMWTLMRKHSYDNGGNVNWWVYFGYHREPIAMNRLLQWNNPPDFSQQIETNGPHIDLNVNPVPPAIN